MENPDRKSGGRYADSLRPFCRRCFFEDTDPGGVYREIQEMISAMPEERRTEETEYRRRLEICSGCSFLGEGTCGVCGCFVELRAAKKDLHCPCERHYW